MNKKLTAWIKPLLRAVVLGVLVIALAFGHGNDALAAGGGRIGGGSFRAPTRVAPAPRSYAPPGGGYGGYGGGYYPGGGIGFPFLFPVFGIGGGFGGLFTILIFLGVANFLVQSFRRARSTDDSLGYDAVSNPTISVARVQVGLLAEARELQTELNQIAASANTGSTEGLAEVLQETSLALLRHPEYWTHGNTTVQQTKLAAAEAQFNRLALAERSKFSRETLSNVNNQLRQAPTVGSLPAGETNGALVESNQEPGEHIVVTLLVGTEGKLDLPQVNSSEDLRRALQQLGGVASDRLLALEVLWTPQAENEVLSKNDLLVEYPELRLV
ncbi:DUF1517 domain-containing protein [Pantanalinema rosaneae CENA516]|uniref:DUF1517 domain-containing protein n=1 Tax=Pantanalinema rosaneae TaxID=1620701 RepID=UPI003D6F5BF0